MFKFIVPSDIKKNCFDSERNLGSEAIHKLRQSSGLKILTSITIKD